MVQLAGGADGVPGSWLGCLSNTHQRRATSPSHNDTITSNREESANPAAYEPDLAMSLNNLARPTVCPQQAQDRPWDRPFAGYGPPTRRRS